MHKLLAVLTDAELGAGIRRHAFDILVRGTFWRYVLVGSEGRGSHLWLERPIRSAGGERAAASPYMLTVAAPGLSLLTAPQLWP